MGKKSLEKQKKLCGEEGFNQFYGELYGERWNEIKLSFEKENQAVEYRVLGAEKSYFLDSASVLAALCLPLATASETAENILDLCAAPGGKTLVLASRMSQSSSLSSNERSPERKHRLATVVQTCLPPQISGRIKVSCSDGATWCTRQSECFDKILLDAPCSSERHVYNDPKYLKDWSPSRIKTVTTEQWALLSSAYRLLKPEGILLYSTCALCPDENDGMIERLFKKFNKDGKSFVLLEPEPNSKEVSDFAKITLPPYEKTKYGWQILPDASGGAGPIYFSVIKKLKSL